MTRIYRVALLLSALALSACATKKEPVAAEPAAPPAATQEATTAAPPPAPVAATETPKPRHVVRKHRKHRKVKVAPKPVEAVPAEVAAPVSAPAPVPAEQPVSAPPPVTAAPTPSVAEQGFLEKYWIWLLIAIIAIVAIAWSMMRKKE